jgi:dipeptidyl aminopeptidase/acylaminoacyl peptidase
MRLCPRSDRVGWATSIGRRTHDSTGSSPSRHCPSDSRRYRRALVLGVAALALTIAALGVVLWPRGSRSTCAVNRLLQDLQVSQVTVTGNGWRPALSPDGKYVVYVRRDGVARSLRMRQLGTDRDVEIVPAQPGLIIQAATVTPDGSFVDFVRGKSVAMTLWRVPFLGGTPRRLIDNVNSPVGWSPDGQHLAFVRAGFDGSSVLLVADADGTNARTVVTSSAVSASVPR